MKISTNIINNFFIVTLTFFTFQVSSVYTHDKAKSRHHSTQISNKVASYWEHKNYAALGKLLSENVGKKIDLNDLYRIAEDINADALNDAVCATINISAKCKNIKISKGEILQLALFIETDLKNKVHKKQYYFEEKKTKLPRSIEVDRENGNIIIYLEKHGSMSVGRGKWKTFNNAILYSVKSPQIVTSGFQKLKKNRTFIRRNVLKEAKIMRKFKGEKGIVKWHSIILHKNPKAPTDDIIFVEKLYKGGSVRKILSSKSHSFSTPEKIKIAKDLIAGLRTFHKKGRCHEDLHAGNCLVDIDGKNKNRKVSAAVTDFARSRSYHKDSVDTSSSHSKAFKHAKYDIQKLGRTLHGLLYNYDPPRGSPSTQPFAKRRNALEKKEKKSELSSKQQFESLILNMLHTDLTKVKNSKEIFEEINDINNMVN